jgi:hypothetical protein
VLAYYKWRVANSMTVAPNPGLMYERSEEDLTTQNFKVDLLGGYTLMGAFGIEASFKRFSFGGNYQTAVSQNLANGIVKTKDRYMLHMSVAL